MITSEQAALLAGSTVRLATLVEMQFVSETMRLWNGTGTLDVAGSEWRGVGAAGSIDGLPQTRRVTADKVTFSLSGIDEQVQRIAARGQADVEQRPVLVWLQLFGDDWQPAGARIPAWWGLMQRLRATRAPQSDGAVRVIAVEAENPYAGRSRPPAGRYTDADQQARHPGDRFFRYVSLQRNKTTTWPHYDPKK